VEESPPAVSILSDRRILLVEGAEVPLTRTQCRFLGALSARPFVVLSRAELGCMCAAAEGSVPAHVKDLRRKLGKLASCIVTVHNGGYSWRPPAVQRAGRSSTEAAICRDVQTPDVEMPPS